MLAGFIARLSCLPWAIALCWLVLEHGLAVFPGLSYYGGWIWGTAWLFTLDSRTVLKRQFGVQTEVQLAVSRRGETVPAGLH